MGLPSREQDRTGHARVTTHAPLSRPPRPSREKIEVRDVPTDKSHPPSAAIFRWAKAIAPFGS